MGELIDGSCGPFVVSARKKEILSSIIISEFRLFRDRYLLVASFN